MSKKEKSFSVSLSRRTDFAKSLSFVKEGKDIFSYFLAEKLDEAKSWVLSKKEKSFSVSLSRKTDFAKSLSFVKEGKDIFSY